MGMSYNNKWFVFYNRMEEALFVYELVTYPPKKGETKESFVFKLTYEVNASETFMF